MGETLGSSYRTGKSVSKLNKSELVDAVRYLEEQDQHSRNHAVDMRDKLGEAHKKAERIFDEQIQELTLLLGKVVTEHVTLRDIILKDIQERKEKEKKDKKIDSVVSYLRKLDGRLPEAKKGESIIDGIKKLMKK